MYECGSGGGGGGGWGARGDALNGELTETVVNLAGCARTALFPWYKGERVCD